MDLETLLRCSWCDRRCRDRTELREHHAQHRREDADAPSPKGQDDDPIDIAELVR